MIKLKTIILFILLLLISPLLSFLVAQPNQVFVGARPLSLGEAFVAVADDGNAIYWNPAGLANLEHIEINFSYANLYGMGIKSYYASLLSRPYFIPFLTDYITFGVDRLGIELGDDDGLEFNNIQYDFAIGLKPPNWVPSFLEDLHYGASLKYQKIEAKYDGFTEVDADGWGWNLGVLYNFDKLSNKLGEFKLGFMLHDIAGTDVRHDNGVPETIHHQHLRGGLCYHPPEKWYRDKIPISNPLFALDIDDRIHCGFECWLLDRIALRAGIQKDLYTNEAITLSFGLGLKLEPKSRGLSKLFVDYALTNPPVLPPTKEQGGLSLILYDNPRLIRIEESHIDDLFASLFLRYGLPSNEIGKVKLRNIHAKDTLYAKILFKSNDYMRNATPITQRIKLSPEQSKDIPLYAIFDKNILSIKDKERLTGTIIVQYEHGKPAQTISTKDHVNFVVHGKNSITWEDPGKAAAFVTKQDEYINDFAKDIVSQYSTLSHSITFITRNIRYAMHIYDALSALNFKWVADPTTPYYEVGHNKQIIDNIDYPIELLKSSSRSGDCDDLSVLYSSLLESIGINTALLSIPTHLFMMFDSDIPDRLLNTLPINKEQFVVYNGTLWIPVEISALQSASFIQAWILGADKYNHELDQENIEIVDIAANQHLEKYPPAYPEYSDTVSIATPQLNNFINIDIATLENSINMYLKNFEDSIRINPNNFKLRNQLAAILAQDGKREEARKQLNYILENNPHHAYALNNMGNLEFLAGNFSKAESLYVIANQFNHYKAGTYFNLAFLYEMMSDVETKMNNVEYRTKRDHAIKDADQSVINNQDFVSFLIGLPTNLSQAKAEEPLTAKDSTKTQQDTTEIKKLGEQKKLSKERWDRKFITVIKSAWKILLEGFPKDAEVLDRAAAKGRDRFDEDPSWYLWWAL